MPKVSHKITGPPLPELERLRAVLDAFAGRYEKLKSASSFGEYASAPTTFADEETLTEQVLQEILESVLDYGKGDYVPQRGKSGLKPDFTPYDLVAHSFVFDAKGSGENLAAHVGQIKGYVDQRSLAYGVLFNLREIRVYARGRKQHEKSLSFSLRPLWEFAHGQALRGPEVDAFERFVDVFKHREVSVDDKIAYIRGQKSWAERLAAGEEPVVDVDYLVEQLRRLALQLAADADVRAGDLADYLVAAPGREQRLIDELKQIALEIAPRTDIGELPAEAAEWSVGAGLAARVWRQYLLRVAYLCLTRILLYRAWEDVQFVDEQLYDGGFDEAYERVQGNIREILGRAFDFGAGKYRTLFASESNYEWYRPTEATLVEVLYQLGPIPLGRTDQDALGALYVSYVDEVDRDRLGQFFTPRDVVRFMLDRAGFRGRTDSSASRATRGSRCASSTSPRAPEGSSSKQLAGSSTIRRLPRPIRKDCERRWSPSRRACTDRRSARSRTTSPRSICSSRCRGCWASSGCSTSRRLRSSSASCVPTRLRRRALPRRASISTPTCAQTPRSCRTTSTTSFPSSRRSASATASSRLMRASISSSATRRMSPRRTTSRCSIICVGCQPGTASTPERGTTFTTFSCSRWRS